MGTVPEPAIERQRFDIGKHFRYPVAGLDQAKFAHARRVDQPAARMRAPQVASGRRMPPPGVVLANVARQGQVSGQRLRCASQRGGPAKIGQSIQGHDGFPERTRQGTARSGRGPDHRRTVWFTDALASEPFRPENTCNIHDASGSGWVRGWNTIQAGLVTAASFRT